VLLTDAIRLQAGDALACVGAGGKTTTCWRLWAETRARGWRPVFTTTTRILEPVLPDDSALLLSNNPRPARMRQAICEVGGLILAASRLPEAVNDALPNPIAPALPSKLAGLQSERLDRLIEALPEMTWLVEADGARGHGLKLPAAREPVIPSRTTLVAVLMHMDVIGHPLDEVVAHRPEALAAYLGLPMGHPIAAGHISRLLVDPAAGLKAVPAGARVVAVLNQRDESAPRPETRQVAWAALASGRYERVLSASLQARRPVLEVFIR